MRGNIDEIFERKLRRSEFLGIGALLAGAGVLAGCGTGEKEGGEAAAAQETVETPTSTSVAVETIPPIEEEPGDLLVFEWAGYEVPDLYQPYLKAGYAQPTFQFLTNDDQAVTKVRAGFQPDVVHPCIGHARDYVAFELAQPWDPALLSNLPSLNPAIIQASQIDGEQYMLPLDWGFSAPLYRADKVEPKEDSWNLFYDERYAGKISWWDDDYNLIIAGYVHGFADPFDMTDEELETVKRFLTEKKKLVRQFWTSQTDMENDMAGGNVWISYAWPSSWVNLKKKGLDVVYMEPKEGRIAWFCGLMLLKDTPNYRHAHAFADAWASPESAVWLISNYAYGHTNTAIDLSKVDQELVKAFKLDDPTALQEPNAHVDRYIPRRKRYSEVWSDVRAA